jgi:molecular chaperone GrpE
MKEDQEIEGCEPREEVDVDGPSSVDDFIRELEAKERDLHISPDLSIEVSDADFDDTNIPDFLKEELAASKRPQVRRPAAAKSAGDPKLAEEVKRLKARLTDVEAECAALAERAKLRIREFDNFMARTERERHETYVNQACKLATLILPVLDNLERALDFAAELPEEVRESSKQFFDGIVLVDRQIHDVLAGMGVRPILAEGQQFDPHLHEAVATHNDDGLEPNSITEEFLRGYQMGNTVIRHSMVRVAASPGSQESIAETDDPAGLEEFTDVSDNGPDVEE